MTRTGSGPTPPARTGRPIRAVLTDIEGTTSSLSFVKDVLFPYSRSRLRDFVRNRGADPEVRRVLEGVAASAGEPLDDEAAVSRLLKWIDEDRKFTPLKALQGLIWEAGYESGAFLGHVYPDAVRHLKAWAEGGLKLYVYSSGSVQAQKLLFRHTEFGDLTPLFTGYFDTRVGSKLEAASYGAVAKQIGLPPAEILFLSDIGAELDAARTAGMVTCQLVRPGAEPHLGHPQAADFDAIPLPVPPPAPRARARPRPAASPPPAPPPAPAPTPAAPPAAPPPEPPAIRVATVAVRVADLGRALRFWTEVMGFTVHGDPPGATDARSLEVGPRDGSVRLRIEAGTARVGSGGAPPPVVFDCDDVRAAHRALAARGVRFAQEPREAPEGLSAVFLDPEGNGFGLRQEGG